MKEKFIKIDENRFIGIDYPSKYGDYGCKCYMRKVDNKFYVYKLEYFEGEDNGLAQYEFKRI